MYLWPGNQFGSQNIVTVDGVGNYNASWARNTPAATKAGIPTSTFVYAGTGCTAATYPATLPTGSWIAVVDGGTAAAQCPYLARMQVAQAAGAKALVVAHNASGAAPTLTGVDDRRVADDPGGRGHAGRRHRDQGRDRRRPEDRQRAEEPGASRHPRR